MTQTRRCPGDQSGAGIKALQTTTTVPQGRAYAGPPVRGRSLWLAVTPQCPWCGAMHGHRTGQTSTLLAGKLQRECPVTGRWYLLAPVQPRREAVRRG